MGTLGATAAWLLLCSMCAPGRAVAHATRPDHSLWTHLLKRFETPSARVDYRALKANGSNQLEAYLKQVAAPWPGDLTANERKAALINAYNALTVSWIVEYYPVVSIWRTPHPFDQPRHTVDGRHVSLDQIEGELRSKGDPRVHAALVCASLSCPPLRREAYVAERLDEQLDDNVRAWLRDASLNRFDPAQRTAEVSMIFKWYKGDFEQQGATVTGFLLRFAPAGRAAFLRDPKAKIDYLPYRWGVNDTAGLGTGYTEKAFLIDRVKNAL